MESQPQNPEFRNNPENLTHACTWWSVCKSLSFTFWWGFASPLMAIFHIVFTIRSAILLTLYLLVSSANNLCKQFGHPESGLIWIQTFGHPDSKKLI